jgi:hypothetical protein
MRLESSRSAESNGLRYKGVKNQSMGVALIGREGRIVKSPVQEIIVGRVPVPLWRREMQSDLHPVALGLVVAELRWGPLAGVGTQRD